MKTIETRLAKLEESSRRQDHKEMSKEELVARCLEIEARVEEIGGLGLREDCPNCKGCETRDLCRKFKDMHSYLQIIMDARA